MKILLPFIILIFLFHHLSFSQNKQQIDSLENELKIFEGAKTKPGNKTSALFDTTKANILNEIAQTYLGNAPEKAIDYAEQCLSLSERIGFKNGIGNSYNNIGAVNTYKGNYQRGLEYYQKAQKLLDEIGDKKGVSISYNGIGVVYLFQDNYPEALKNYLSSLKLREEIGDKNGMASSFHNVGMIYGYMENNQLALDYFLKAKKLNLEIGNKRFLSNNLAEIGVIEVKQGNNADALKNYLQAIKIKEEIGDKYGLANSFEMIGLIKFKIGDYPEALKNYFTSLKIFEEIEDKYGISSLNIYLGEVYEKQGKLKEALKYTREGLETASNIGNKDNVKEAYKELAVIDSAMGNFRGSYENHKLYMQVNDSMFNMERDKKLTSLQMQYDFDKKESLTKAEQDKKDAIALKEVQKQKLVRNGFVSGFAVVLLFAGVFFKQRNKISKGKKRSDELLLNILPSEVAEELKENGTTKAKQFDEVTVMFTDFKNFTQISEKLSPSELVAEIHTCFKAFDDIIGKHNIEKIKTIGDSYMCAGGLPIANKTNATDVVWAALEIQQFIQEHLRQRKKEGKEPFEIRIGVHTGSVVAGIVGVKKFAYDIWGDTVNIASRMESSGEAGKVNISGSTYELVKGKFNCRHRGKIHAKNKGEIDMYFIEPASFHG